MDKVLFKEEWLSIKEHNGYTYVHEERCNGKLIVVLPFRKTDNDLQYLMRKEVCPAHGDMHEFCGIMGGYDDPTITIEQTVVKEMKEETGFDIELSEVNYINWVWDSKVADTKVYLFTCDLTEKTPGIATTDGTELEKTAYCKWVSFNECMNTHDSKIHTILNMVVNSNDDR